MKIEIILIAEYVRRECICGYWLEKADIQTGNNIIDYVYSYDNKIVSAGFIHALACKFAQYSRNATAEEIEFTILNYATKFTHEI